MADSGIAILGATSHIAKGIILHFAKNRRGSDLMLFARATETVKDFLSHIRCIEPIPVLDISKFPEGRYSAVINCVGFGNPKKLAASGAEIFNVTEIFDNLVLNHLRTFPETQYINLSSGAIYGDFVKPADNNTVLHICPNHIPPRNYYGLAKLYSEVKHRAETHMNIVDLRIFGYFSRFIDLDSGYLLADIAKSVLNSTPLTTTDEDISRDYVHPADLYQIIRRCMENKKINCAVDVYSKKSVTKFDILRTFQAEFGLQYTMNTPGTRVNPTGIKSNYFSSSKNAGDLGYDPEYSSLDGLLLEMREMKNASDKLLTD